MEYTNLKEDGFPEKAGGGLEQDQTSAPPTAAANNQAVLVNATTHTGQQMVVLVVPPSAALAQLAANHARWLLIMGAIQLTLGILEVLLNIPATFMMLAIIGYVGAGYWCGILTIITGAFGIAAGKKRNRCYAITFMVMSIITSVFTLGGLVPTAAIGPAILHVISSRHHDDVIGFNVTFLVIAAVEFKIAVVSSALCCAAICGRKYPAAGNAQYRMVNGQVVPATNACQSGDIHGGAMAGGAVHSGNATSHAVQPGGPAQQNVIMMSSQQLPIYQQSGSPPPAYVQQQ